MFRSLLVSVFIFMSKQPKDLLGVNSAGDEGEEVGSMSFGYQLSGIFHFSRICTCLDLLIRQAIYDIEIGRKERDRNAALAVLAVTVEEKFSDKKPPRKLSLTKTEDRCNP